MPVPRAAISSSMMLCSGNMAKRISSAMRWCRARTTSFRISSSISVRALLLWQVKGARARWRAAHRFTQRFHAAKLNEIRDPGPKIIAEQKGREGAGVIDWQGTDFSVRASLIEKWDRIALMPRANDAMLGRLDAACTPKLEQLTKIDRERVLERCNIYPAARARMRLESRHAVLRQ